MDLGLLGLNSFLLKTSCGENNHSLPYRKHPVVFQQESGVGWTQSSILILQHRIVVLDLSRLLDYLAVTLICHWVLQCCLIPGFSTGTMCAQGCAEHSSYRIPFNPWSIPWDGDCHHSPAEKTEPQRDECSQQSQMWSRSASYSIHPPLHGSTFASSIHALGLPWHLRCTDPSVFLPSSLGFMCLSWLADCSGAVWFIVLSSAFILGVGDQQIMSVSRYDPLKLVLI